MSAVSDAGSLLVQPFLPHPPLTVIVTREPHLSLTQDRDETEYRESKGSCGGQKNCEKRVVKVRKRKKKRSGCCVMLPLSGADV